MDAPNILIGWMRGYVSKGGAHSHGSKRDTQMTHMKFELPTIYKTYKVLHGISCLGS